jgi:hypothetical protein
MQVCSFDSLLFVLFLGIFLSWISFNSIPKYVG